MTSPLTKKINAELAPEAWITSGKTNYTYEEALAEFIDNSLSAARGINETVSVVVKVYVEDNVPKSIEISDNGKGIAEDKIPSVIALGKKNTSGGEFNEHGMGLKQAAYWLGDRHVITTTTSGYPYILSFSPISSETTVSYFEKKDVDDSFTKISITLKNSSSVPVESRKLQNTILQIGARYRRFLSPDSDGITRLKIQYDVLSKNGSESDFSVSSSTRVDSVRPVYYKAGTDDPFLNRKRVKAEDGSWEIELTLGLAPMSGVQWTNLGISEPPKKGHPYHVCLDRQGLDILIKGRVIQFHQLSEIGLVTTSHNSYNFIRGEINLLKGFSTQRTKNGLLTDSRSWPQMIERVRAIMQNKDEAIKIGRDLLSVVPDDDLSDVDEIIYHKRVVDLMKRNRHMNPGVHDVLVEQPLGQGIDVRADIILGEQIWEIKKGEGTPADLMQLVMYLTITGHNQGYLVASSFKQATTALAVILKNKLGLNLTLTKHSDISIDRNVSQAEEQWQSAGGFSVGYSSKPEFQ